MKRAVFLDRDGTINIDTGYINDPDEFVFIRGAKKGIKLLKDNGFFIFVVTNQSGVGRGYFSVNDLKSVNNKLVSELCNDGISIDGIYFCPHMPGENCRCRKPKPKMVYDIAGKYKINLEKSYFVGDKLLDVHTGKNAGCETILINTETDSYIEDEENWTPPGFVAKNLYEAAKWIVKESKKSKVKRKNQNLKF